MMDNKELHSNVVFYQRSSITRQVEKCDLLVHESVPVADDVYWFPSGWAQKRLPSMDADDFETIPSSAEESSNSSEEEGSNKTVGGAHLDGSTCIWTDDTLDIW